jgi:hypothetical protein
VTAGAPSGALPAEAETRLSGRRWELKRCVAGTHSELLELKDEAGARIFVNRLTTTPGTTEGRPARTSKRAPNRTRWPRLLATGDFLQDVLIELHAIQWADLESRGCLPRHTASEPGKGNNSYSQLSQAFRVRACEGGHVRDCQHIVTSSEDSKDSGIA